MSSIINNIEFFTDHLKYTRDHRRTTYVYNDAIDEIFNKHNIYTDIYGHQRLKMGETFQIGNFSVIEQYSMLLCGNRFHTIGAFSSTVSSLPINTIIGRYSSIAQNVKRMQGGHPMSRFTTSMLTYAPGISAFNDYLEAHQESILRIPHGLPNDSPIVIGNDVWVGQDVTFSTNGITVGDGAVIAAGSIVTKDVPPYAIVGGVPAKVIKYRFDEKIIEALLELKWWQYGFADFKGIGVDEPIEVFIEKLKIKIEGKEISPFYPKCLTFHDLQGMEMRF